MSLTGFNRRRRNLKKEKEIDYEEEVKKYHVGGGWYDLPGIEDNKRKEEAIKILKESDK